MKTTDIFIYFHIAAVGRYQDVLSDMYSILSVSGILDIVKECRCFITGPPQAKDWIVSFFAHPKCKIVAYQEDVSSYERFTLDRLHHDCLESTTPFKVLYLHSKGVSKKDPKNASTSDIWRKLMMQMLVANHSICLHHLENHETVGIMFVAEPLPHYSGNFWWANSTYIRTLPRIRNPMIFYIDCELWIGLCLQNAVSLYQLGNRTTVDKILSIQPSSIPDLPPTPTTVASNYTPEDKLRNVLNAYKMLLHLGYDAFELRRHGLCFDLCDSDIVRVVFTDPPHVVAMTGTELMTVFPALFYKNYV